MQGLKYIKIMLSFAQEVLMRHAIQLKSMSGLQIVSVVNLTKAAVYKMLSSFSSLQNRRKEKCSKIF